MIAASIAFRNLFLHRAKTLMIGSIMGLGIMALFVGNSLIDTAVDGLARVFVRGYTGDFMLTGPTVFPTTVFAETAGGEEVVPHIAQASTLQGFLGQRKDVRAVLPMLSGKTAYGLGEESTGEIPLFGVDVQSYRDFFPDNIELVAGSWPQSGGKAWLLLPEAAVARLQARSASPVGVGSRITLSAAGDYAGTVIREVELAAVFRFRQGNRDLARMGLADADTLRDLLGFASLRDGPVVLSDSEKAFVEAFDPEALFADETVAVPPPVADSIQVTETPSRSTSSAPEPAWQFLLVSMARGAPASKAMAAARSEVARVETEARVQGWVEGAGTVARSAMTVRLAFDLLVMVVAVVVVIVTMNALVVSIGERIPEIGTLRAIGARRAFVRSMVLYETVFLALIAGAVGLAAGGLVLFILSRVGIRAPNLFFEALFGGPLLLPKVSIGAALKAFLWILTMSLVAAWYPAVIALRIKPVTAMHSD